MVLWDTEKQNRKLNQWKLLKNKHNSATSEPLTGHSKQTNKTGRILGQELSLNLCSIPGNVPLHVEGNKLCSCQEAQTSNSLQLLGL